ncbi:MAG TPA: serine hydrolase, partial [Candidatus Dormibacteraeota bacterium]|nr:serine hydrolase [Candidatus Dormibacteraeota bacterium]
PWSSPTRTPSATLTAAAMRHLVAIASAAVSRDPLFLTAVVDPLATASGGSVGVTLSELGGAAPITWSYNGGGVFTAASTYKLAALMMEAQGIASGAIDPNGLVCYQDSDYEDGWYDDYTDGACYTRNELAYRAGHDSDNTAGHMLVRDLGGADALNAWAASYGAVNSVFFTDNTTTADDLASLWSAEATGKLGGAAAQGWLYPLLTETETESGIPAGVGATTVVHKTGTIDAVDNDAALVVSGPNGAYILTVMTDGVGGDAGWQLIAAISADVWTFEAARAAK